MSWYWYEIHAKFDNHKNDRVVQIVSESPYPCGSEVAEALLRWDQGKSQSVIVTGMLPVDGVSRAITRSGFVIMWVGCLMALLSCVFSGQGAWIDQAFGLSPFSGSAMILLVTILGVATAYMGGRLVNASVDYQLLLFKIRCMEMDAEASLGR